MIGNKFLCDRIEKISRNRIQNAAKSGSVLVNDKTFLGVGGYGFDAVIAKKFDTHTRRGLRGYIYLIAREFFKYNPFY